MFSRVNICIRVLRGYTYRSRQAVSPGTLKFEENLRTRIENAESVLPPVEQLQVSYFVPKRVEEANNVTKNTEALYFGARKLQTQTETGVEIRFNVIEATWLDDETKRKIYKYNLTNSVINVDGELVIRKDDSTYQIKNLKLALKELQVFIKKCQTETWHRAIDGHSERQSVRNKSIKTFRSLDWMKAA